jgi:hypothetical protein
MAKKKRQAIAPATSKQTPEKNLTDSFQRKAWLQFVVVFLFISASIVYLYQEAAFSGYRLNISDVQGQGLPYEQFRQDFEKEHKEPALWLPHIFAGMPFHASGSYRIRYTVETFFQALPNFVATLYNGSFGLNLLLGALFMFILLRSYGVTVVAALAGAVIFVFTTKVLGTPHTNRITTFMHIPIIFYAVKEIWKEPRWWLVLILGAAVGSQLGSYHPQISHLTAILVVVFVIYHAIGDYRRDKELRPLLIRGSYLLGGLVVAMLLAIIVIWPLAEYLPYSIRGAKTAASTGGGGLSADYATAWSLSWTEILTFVIPGYVGFGDQTYWGEMPFTTFPNYLGIIAVLLALGYFATQRKEKSWLFWLLMFVLALAIALGRHLPPVSWLLLHYLPYFNKFREPAMLTIINSFVIATTAALFLEALRRPQELPLTKLKKWLPRVAALFIVLLLVFVLFATSLEEIYNAWYRAADNAKGRFTQYSMQQLAPLYAARFALLQGDIIRISLLALAGVGLVWLYLQEKLRYQWLAIAILGLIAIDLFVPGRQAIKPQYAKKAAKTHFAAGNPVAEWLQEREPQLDYRIFPLEEFQANEFVYYGIPSIGGYHAVKMANFQAYLDDVGISSRPLIDMLATRYFISERNLPLAGLRPLTKIDKKVISLNQQALPYARFVEAIGISSDRDSIRTALKNGSLDVRRLAIVEAPNAELQTQTFRLDSSSTITMSERHAQLMRFQLNNPNPGFIVIAEMHYPPGWRAYVDGQETEMYLVNAGLMGVAVPANSNELLLRYEQPSFYLARTISRLTFWLIIITLLSYAGYTLYRLRQQPAHAVK